MTTFAGLMFAHHTQKNLQIRKINDLGALVMTAAKPSTPALDTFSPKHPAVPYTSRRLPVVPEHTLMGSVLKR